MNKLTPLSLDSILIFILVVPYIMTYGLLPGDTPYWLFGLIFVSIILFLGLDLVSLKEKIYNRLKLFFLSLIIILVLATSFVGAIISRHTVAPVYGVHDIILQQEAAIRYTLDGKNPYKENYFGTPLEDWHYSETEVNPALYHYVMQPLYHIFPLPFYYVSNRTLGYFDARIPLFLLVFTSFVLAYLVPKNALQKRMFVILLAFNPAMLGYTLEGRSDMFMYPFILTSLFLLYKKRLIFSAIFMAFAFAIKQSIWPILPFYMFYLWKKGEHKNFAKSLAIFAIVFLAFILPYIMWDKDSYLTSTIFYLSGQTENSYPVSGYGLGMLLSQLGILNDRYSYYPFLIWQLVFCIPLLVFFLYYLNKNTSVKRLLVVYGLFLFVYWYLSRYFNNSHLGYLTVIFLTAYFWPEEEKSVVKS